MANCVYCGETAGFLRWSHKECKHRNREGKKTIISLIASAKSKDDDLKTLESSIKELASSSHIDRASIKQLITQGWEQAVEIAFDDGILSEDEETVLNKLKEHFSLSQQALDKNGAYTKMAKGAVLRSILDGKVPKSTQVSGDFPFNLQKTEKIVWVFENVEYFKKKAKTRFVGGSKAVSVRIAKGLYYRQGAFKGERVQTSKTIHVDTGSLGVTTKHLYFKGASESFRINFKNIVSFDRFSDAISVQRDTQRVKHESFVTGDGWFTYNLITNVARME